MATKTVPILVGSRVFLSNTYYGFDTGPTIYYGTAYSTEFVGKDGELYIVHACRWYTGNNTYMRLDNPNISSSDSYTSYTTSVFDSITIGSTTYSASSVNSGFTVNGGAGMFWNTSSSPFSSVGTTTNLVLNGVEVGPYGFEVFSSTGDLVLSPGRQKINIIDTGSVAVNAGTTSGNISCEGLTSSNSDTIAIIIRVGFNGIVINRYTGYFTITNSTAANTTIHYITARLK